MSSKSEVIEQTCYQIEDCTKAIDLVESIDSAKELYSLISYYNFDDGYKVPMAILNHPLCELAHAIKIYWLLDADRYYENNAELDELERDDYEFCKFLEKRIKEGFYKVKEISHDENFDRVKLYYLKKSSLPSIFYQPVVAKD